MSDEDESSQRARAGFDELCRALNMDEEAGSEAWKTYEKISRNFTLEVRMRPGVVLRRPVSSAGLHVCSMFASSMFAPC